MAKRILLVDDNKTNLQVLFEALAPEGYELLVAQSGEQALEATEEIVPDLVLLDIKMPGIGGFETFRRLRANERTAKLPIVFLSALADIAKIDEARRIGAEGYLTKPFKFDDLISKVRELLDRAC